VSNSVATYPNGSLGAAMSDIARNPAGYSSTMASTTSDLRGDMDRGSSPSNLSIAGKYTITLGDHQVANLKVLAFDLAENSGRFELKMAAPGGGLEPMGVPAPSGSLFGSESADPRTEPDVKYDTAMQLPVVSNGPIDIVVGSSRGPTSGQLRYAEAYTGDDGVLEAVRAAAAGDVAGAVHGSTVEPTAVAPMRDGSGGDGAPVGTAASSDEYSDTQRRSDIDDDEAKARRRRGIKFDASQHDDESILHLLSDDDDDSNGNGNGTAGSGHEGRPGPDSRGVGSRRGTVRGSA